MPTYDLAITVTGHDKASGVFKPIEGSLRRILEIAGGIVASRVILGLADNVMKLFSASVAATAQLQLMQVSLESLAARELVRASEGTETLATVQGKATNMARGMMDQLARMSILSPYTVQAVQNTFRLNTAFGYTFKQAERMTDGLLKMAAGVGADNEQLNRMAYNLAQVRLQGSVTALDIRQLALAGIDLRDVLKDVSKQFGFNITDHKDFNKLIKEGKITWEQFSEGFARYADKYFGKASEKMARTLLGLKSTFHDVFILTMPQIIGPSVEKVTDILGGLLDMFIKIRDTDFLTKLGQRFSASIGSFLQPVDKAIDKLNSWINLWLIANQHIESKMGFREAAIQLREMEAPLDIIKDAVNEIFGPTIGGFIIRWGENIINTAMKVKTALSQAFSGDFTGAFKTLGTPQVLIDFVQDVIKAIGNLKIFWDENGPAIKSIFLELGRGILEFAGIQVGEAIEGTGGLFERLTNKIIDNAPKIVENLRTVKDWILNQLLPALDRFFNKLTGEWIPAILDFANYLRTNWEPILRRIVTIAGVLLAVFAGFTVLKTITTFVFGLVGAFGSLITGLAGLAGATAMAGGFAAVVSAAFPVIVILVGAVAAAFVGFLAAVAGAVTIGLIVYKNWERVVSIFNILKDIVGRALAPAFDELRNSLGPLRAAWGELSVALQPVANLLGAILTPILKGLAVLIGGILVNAFALFVGGLTGFVGLLTGMVQTVTAVVQSFAVIIAGIVNIVKGLFDSIVGVFNGDGARVNAAAAQITEGLKQVFGGVVGAILSLVLGMFGTLLSGVSGFATGFASVWSTVWGAVVSRTTGSMQQVASFIRNKWNEVLNTSRAMGSQFASIGPNIIAGIKAGINNGWAALVNWFKNKIKDLISAATGALQIQSPSRVFVDIGKQIPAGLMKGIGNLDHLINARVVAPLRSIPDRVGGHSSVTNNKNEQNYYAPVYQIVQQAPDRFASLSLD